MAQLDETSQDVIDLILMVVQYSLLVYQSISIAFVNQSDDVKVMFLKVCVQGDDPFSMGLNPYRIARRDLKLVL